MSSDDLFGTGENDVCDELFFDVSPHHKTVNEDYYQTFTEKQHCTYNHESRNFACHFENLSKNDICTLIDEIIANENIRDGSPVIFQIFCKYMENTFSSMKFTRDDVENLEFISQAITKLRNSEKFNEYALVDLLLDRYLTFPFELIWWLHKQQVVYLEQYWDVRHPENIADQLITVLRLDDQNCPFEKDAILQDILTELLSGCYGPRMGICRLYKSKLWFSYCSNVLNEFTEKILAFVLENTDKPLYNFLSLIRTSELLPSSIKNRFYSSIIQKLVTYKTDEYSIDSAFLYQQLWTTENIPKNLAIIFREIFLKYCDFSDVIKVFDSNDHNNLNCKFLLAAVAACIKFSKRSQKQLQETVQKNLNLMFKGGKITHYKIAILFIRQAAMERTMELKYEAWYSDMFGLNSGFKTVENQTMFKFFISCLNKVIPLEPKYFLKIHLSRSLRAPPKCNTSVLDYKNLCRSRLHELQRYPTIVVNNLEVNVLQMIENTYQSKNVDLILFHIMKSKYEEFCEKVVPYLLRDGAPFVSVKEMLLSRKLISSDLLAYCKVAEDIVVIEDDSDDNLVFIK